MSSEISAVPLLVLGDTRQRLLAERLLTGVRPWLLEWNAASGTEVAIRIVESSNASVAQTIASATRMAVARVQGAPQFFVAASDGGLAHVLGLPRLTMFADSGSTLALDVANELLVSLVTGVSESCGMQGVQVDVADEAMPTPIMHDARWWAAAIDCGTHKTCVLLVISPQLIAKLLPPVKVSQTSGPEPRNMAILEDAVRLQVVLGEAQLTVGELASLEIDDVLVLNVPLSHTASLETTDGRRVASVSLGRVEDKRAVSVCR